MTITDLKGVGEASAKLLNKLELNNVSDLINNIPRRYDDFSNIIRVSTIGPGMVTVKVKLSSVKKRYSKKGLHITEALASDETGSVRVMWFNQPYRANSIKPDVEYFLSGEYASNYRYFVITNPVTELVSSFPLHTARIVPQYKLTKGISSNQIRRFTKVAFDVISPKEILPNWLIEDCGLIGRKTALFNLHFPESLQDIETARMRIGFDEVFELTLASELNKKALEAEKGNKISFDEQYVKDFVTSLPFKLTDDQRKCSWQIYKDMGSSRPMNRLLEGDVGSGKTVVAVMAAISAVKAGYQVAFMAPTEILAKQHFHSISVLLKSSNLKVQAELITGSLSKKVKQGLQEKLSSKNGVELIIGTHALIQSDIKFHKLGLIIIDEQHRFGVEQRKLLQAKAKTIPHMLHMSATPIPRSLALTLYGELDISRISEMPKGRKMVDTKVYIPENREIVYQKVKEAVANGNQAFVVSPLIEQGDDKKLKSVETLYKELSKKYLKGLHIEMLHGKMKSEEKESIMQSFVHGKVDVLISTTVIEVGVDIPNASIMVIESAENFGLAQLHQLRGRVGRGSQKSECLLVLSENDTYSKRIGVMERVNDGFKLADYDLELRGPGAIYGTFQHGALDLRVAKLTDIELIKLARLKAKEFIKKSEKLVQYSELKARVDKLRVITNLN